MMLLFGNTILLRFLINLDQVTISASRNCLDTIELIVCMSGNPMNLRLPTADTIVHNSRILFHQSCNASCNKIVQWFVDIGVF